VVFQKYFREDSIMTFDFQTRTAVQRKNLVNAVSSVLELPRTYLGIATVSYQVGDFNISRWGVITCPDDTDKPLVDKLLEGLHRYGYRPAVEPANVTAEQDHVIMTPQGNIIAEIHTEDLIIPEPEPKPPCLTISVPANLCPAGKIDNLQKMADNKTFLLLQSFGVDSLPPISTSNGTINFPWFSPDASGEQIEAYKILLIRMCKTAANLTRVTAKPVDPAIPSPRFALRWWLVSIGLVGDEFSRTRKILLQNLPGDSGSMTHSGVAE
jgi:hypothetical protein